MVKELFGRPLTHRKITRTTNDFEDVTAESTTDTLFTGDLQFGMYLDTRLVQAGWLQAGDAALYVDPDDSVSSTIAEGDLIIDGDTSLSGTYSAWEVTALSGEPKVGEPIMHYLFRCKRRDDITVS